MHDLHRITTKYKFNINFTDVQHTLKCINLVYGLTNFQSETTHINKDLERSWSSQYPKGILMPPPKTSLGLAPHLATGEVSQLLTPYRGVLLGLKPRIK